MVYINRLFLLFHLCSRLIWVRFYPNLDKKNLSKRIVFDEFRQLGGVYVKFLQILSLNGDFMKGWSGPKELHVFEAVDTESLDVHLLLTQELPSYSSQFRYVEKLPFAAGSFAQVYRAQLHDGRDVVIKVLRPSLAKSLKFDLRILRIITMFIKFLYPSSLVDIHQAYSKFAQTTLSETDYQKEVSNALWFYDYFQNTPDIVVPWSFKDLSTKHVITQEYIGGMSLSDVLIQQKMGQDPEALVMKSVGSDIWEQLTRLGTEFLKSTLVADFVFGDPHPGNIKLLPDNKIGLIDFGIIASAPPNRSSFLRLMSQYRDFYNEYFDARKFTIAMVNFFDEDLAEALIIIGKYLNPEQPVDILGKVAESAAMSLDEIWEKQSTQELFRQKKMLQLFGNTLNKGNRFSVKLSMDSAATLRSAQTFLALINNIGEQTKNFEIRRGALHNAVSFAENSEIQEHLDISNTMETEQAIELVSGWLSQVADRDPFLYQRLAGSINI